MIERVARAMYAADPDCTQVSFEACNEANYFTILAKAAIEAMREPTRGMIKTGDRHSELMAESHDNGEIYSVMIDAALES
jgi:hypothetical protein